MDNSERRLLQQRLKALEDDILEIKKDVIKIMNIVTLLVKKLSSLTS